MPGYQGFIFTNVAQADVSAINTTLTVSSMLLPLFIFIMQTRIIVISFMDVCLKWLYYHITRVAKTRDIESWKLSFS